MRKNIISIAAPLMIAALIGCGKTTNEQATPKPETKAQPAVATVAATIDLPTAKCENCEKTITNAVQNVDGVTDVKVDAKNHVAKVQYIAAKTNVASLENTISKAGYTANKTQRNKAAYDKLDECCK